MSPQLRCDPPGSLSPGKGADKVSTAWGCQCCQGPQEVPPPITHPKCTGQGSPNPTCFVGREEGTRQSLLCQEG